jgi:hypothetical protein
MLKDDFLISRIFQLYSEVENRISFHKESQSILKEMSKLDFLSKVFEENLLDTFFLKRKWTSFDIPSLCVYTSDDFEIRYHFFLPPQSRNTETAAYLIHHHKDFILSSYVFFGEGYQTIQFDKEIKTNLDGMYSMKISRDFFHAKGDINILDSWKPHVIFNVCTPTATLVLWSKDNNSVMKINQRENYYLDNHNFVKISDQEFINEAQKENEYEEDSEKHIQAICYFMQQMGYQNTPFVKQILKSDNFPATWDKWLSFLISKDDIDAPAFNEEINILKKKMSIHDFHKACS